MNCTNKRTIFDLFNVYNCKDCEHNKNDEIFYIGNNVIAIYYLINLCQKFEVNTIKETIFSDKMKILLKDAFIFFDRIILLVIEDFNINKYQDIIDTLLEFKLDIQIICY